MTVKARLYHLQLNVRDGGRSLPFYRALFGQLEWRTLHDAGGVAGFSDGAADIWVMEAGVGHSAAGYHRKRAGLNHLAFAVPRREDVDRFAAEFVRPRGLAALYGTPREFPEYVPGYYAVFFEDPDRVKLEVVHRPGLGGAGG